MLIRIGFDIELSVATPMALIYLLRVHPSRRDDLVMPEDFRGSGGLVPEEYMDAYGNHCGRVNVPLGRGTVRRATKRRSAIRAGSTTSTSRRASTTRPSCRRRRCSSCCRAATARSTASFSPSPGAASATRRPAGRGSRRSAISCTSTWPSTFEVFLGDRWYTFDARHNCRRIGRIVMARGRDAGDVPITMCFGPNSLVRFEVATEEIAAQRRSLAA